MELKPHQQKAYDYIVANPGATMEQVSAGSKLQRPVCVGVVRQLITLNVLSENKVDDLPATYSVAPEKTATEKKGAKKTTAAEQAQQPADNQVAEPASSPAAAKKGRDNGKYTFQGQTYNKGRLVLAVIKKYCEDHQPTTLQQLLEAFPADEVKPFGYGLARVASEAKTIGEESGRARFFTKDDEIIKLSKRVSICVTNQITSDLLARFLVVSKRHRYVVKPA